MGNKNPKFGYRILEVKHNSPAEAAGLQPYLDYILGISSNGKPLIASSSDISKVWKVLSQYEGKGLELDVYNLRTSENRTVTIIPSRSWPGADGLLGLTFRDEKFRDSAPLLTPLEIVGFSNDWRDKGGALKPFEDYIIGVKDHIYYTLDQFRVYFHRTAKMELCVYNTIRGDVKFVPVETGLFQDLPWKLEEAKLPCFPTGNNNSHSEPANGPGQQLTKSSTVPELPTTLSTSSLDVTPSQTQLSTPRGSSRQPPPPPPQGRSKQHRHTAGPSIPIGKTPPPPTNAKSGIEEVVFTGLPRFGFGKEGLVDSLHRQYLQELHERYTVASNSPNPSAQQQLSLNYSPFAADNKENGDKSTGTQKQGYDPELSTPVCETYVRYTYYSPKLHTHYIIKSTDLFDINLDIVARFPSSKLFYNPQKPTSPR